MATSTLTPSEEAQLAQTIEMFEVITQSQPDDYQSLEILKEAYSKAGREEDAVKLSKRIAQSYAQMGQFSSAILEYETVLQRFPDDAEAQAALKELESKSNSFTPEPSLDTLPPIKRPGDTAHARRPGRAIPTGEVEDGRRHMQKLFVDSRIIAAADFDQCWPKYDYSFPPADVTEPFIQVLADKGLVPIEQSLKLLCDKSRAAFLPLNLYDVDMDLARTFPAEICRRWCVLPFDRMSKSILVATANPFNQQAGKELAEASGSRFLWYLVPPLDLVKNLRKAFR